MTDKKLYDDIRGVKRERRDQTMLDIMALFDEQKDETLAWQRRAEWLADELAETFETYCPGDDYTHPEYKDKAYWLRRAEEEA